MYNNADEESMYRTWRLNRRIPLKYIANRIGVSVNAISMFERGKMWSERIDREYLKIMFEWGE